MTLGVTYKGTSCAGVYKTPRMPFLSIERRNMLKNAGFFQEIIEVPLHI
jgi:hypothetical protein